MRSCALLLLLPDTDHCGANDDDVSELGGLRPDPWGHLFVDLSLAGESYAYVALLELTLE